MVRTANYKTSAFIMVLVSTTTTSQKCFVISQVPKKPLDTKNLSSALKERMLIVFLPWFLSSLTDYSE
jgi:hypothetical protein